MFEKKPKIVDLKLIDDIISNQNNNSVALPMVEKPKRQKKTKIGKKVNTKIDDKGPEDDIPWL